jgi:hypothetical protein
MSLQPGWRWVIWVAYVVAWTTALLMSNPVHMERDQRLLRDALFTFAKTVHVSAYAVFALLTCWLVATQWVRVALFCVLLGHAVGTEILQDQMPFGRTGSPWDVALDVFGIVLGTAIARLLFNRPQAPGEPAETSVPADPDAAAPGPPQEPAS